jgi:predicted RNase H-like HicB family nuclease
MIQTHDDEIQHYLSLPYAIVLLQDEDGTWFAKIPDLPGCMTVGETQAEALDMLEDAKRTWISGRIYAGDPVPEPQFAV